MTRITKDPEERKKELVDTAEKLFIEKGFDKTMVSDVVRELGVAQGTFYYYFKSKEEVMEEIIDIKWREYASILTGKLEAIPRDSARRLQQFFRLLLVPELDDGKRLHFNILINSDVMKKFHRQLDEARVRYLKPIIEDIVTAGIREKKFKAMDYSAEVTEMVFYGINFFLHLYSQQFGDMKILLEKTAAIQELLERVLGLEKGSLTIIQFQTGGI